MTQKRRKPKIRQAKQARSQETVDAILAATTQILLKQGYEAATTNQIAKVAGVSIGSLYQYFRDRESILAELIERKFVSIMNTFVENLAGVRDLPLQQGIREVIRAMVEARRLQGDLRRVFDEEIPKVGKLARLREFQKEAATLVNAYFKFHENEIQVKDLELAAYFSVHAVEALLLIALRERPELYDNGKLENELVLLISRYLGAKVSA